MKEHWKSSTLAALTILAAPPLTLAQGDYDYESVDYPGMTETLLFGINNHGTAVGNGRNSPDTFPFVYDAKKGALTDVAPIAGYRNTTLLGISDSGVLVGYVEDADARRTSGVIVDSNGAATVFDHPDALTFTQARGVNKKGLVTGYRDSPGDRSAPENGFIYDSGTGTFTDIVRSLATIAHGINSRGDVVGSARFDEAIDPCPDLAGSSRHRGWLRTSDGRVSFFNVNGKTTRARGITDSGSIAGFVNDGDAVKGFVVELDESECQEVSLASDELLGFPGATYTMPLRIGNSGEIVGIYEVGDATGSRGFIATPK